MFGYKLVKKSRFKKLKTDVKYLEARVDSKTRDLQSKINQIITLQKDRECLLENYKSHDKAIREVIEGLEQSKTTKKVILTRLKKSLNL